MYMNNFITCGIFYGVNKIFVDFMDYAFFPYLASSKISLHSNNNSKVYHGTNKSDLRDLLSSFKLRVT